MAINTSPTSKQQTRLWFVFQLKQMEVQLEEEYDEKQKVLKEKRELESKLLSAEDRVGPGSAASTWTSNHRDLCLSRR